MMKMANFLHSLASCIKKRALHGTRTQLHCICQSLRFRESRFSAGVVVGADVSCHPRETTHSGFYTSDL